MRIIPLSLLASTLLAACGGGGSDAGSPTAPTAPSTGPSTGPVAPPATTVQTSTVPTPTVGDYYTYRSTLPANRTHFPPLAVTPESYLRTHTYTQSGATVMRTTTWGGSERDADQALFSGAAALATFRPASSELCGQSYSPGWSEVPATVTVGSTRESSASIANVSPMNCSSTHLPATISVKGRAVGTETMQVPAGTFATIKLVYETTQKRQNDTVVTSMTCWRDVVSGMNVRCDSSATTTPTGGTPVQVTDSEELVAYATSATGRRKDGVERFAGSWRGYTGSEARDCRLTFETSGKVVGDCRSMFPYFNLAANGRIAADGSVEITIESHFGTPSRFTGKAGDPLTLSGSASTATGTERWDLKHY